MRSPEPQDAAPQAPAVFVIRLEGEFDIADREPLIEAFATANSAGHVVIDLERVDYIDSTVLSCLVTLHRSTQQRGAELVLVGVNNHVHRLFEVTELHALFTIRESAKELTESRAGVRRLTIQGRSVN